MAAAGGALATTKEGSVDQAQSMIGAAKPFVLDVRRAAEHRESAIDGSLNIAHTRLFVRLSEVPTDQPVLGHCASGARSAHAAALLTRHGIHATTVADQFARYGAPITAATASA